MGLQGSSRCLYALSEQRDGPSWNAGGEGERMSYAHTSARTRTVYTGQRSPKCFSLNLPVVWACVVRGQSAMSWSRVVQVPKATYRLQGYKPRGRQ